MAPPRGRRANPPLHPAGLLFAAGRMVGFTVMAAVAVAVVSSVVLLPAYAQWVRAQYERDCLLARTKDLEALSNAHERLIAALPTDRVLTMRLAISHEALRPAAGSRVPLPGADPATPPGLIRAVSHPRPAPPPDWLMHLDARLQRPATRRGLLLLAAGAVVVDMFVFAPPEKYHRPRAARRA